MRIFSRVNRSLFGEILDWLLTLLLLLWPISLALTWLVAQNLANKPFDRTLAYNAQALAQYLWAEPGQAVRFTLPRSDDADRLYHQVLDERGRLLSGERDLPAPPPPQGESALPEAGPVAAVLAQPQLRDAEFHGLPVRVAWLWTPLPGQRGARALVQVAETREKRNALAADIIKGVMLPQFAILPLAVLLVWLALARGIKPLSELEERIRARRPDDLSPLDDRAVPQELAPLVQSVNDLLTRLTDSVQTQKRFLADAAHQLKTPLAGLRMQAELAQREGASQQELKASLQHIGLASVRATHTVNQLLALARAESGSAAAACQSVDLAALGKSVVHDAVPAALERRVDLGYDGPEPGDARLQRMGNPVLLREMLGNLVDNALHYAPGAHPPGAGSATEVTVRVRLLPHGLALEVEDNGPGVPEAERELVFQPFYRALGTNVDGTGLGLSIVREIARQHGADVSVHPARPGHAPPGARFTVLFGESKKIANFE